MTAPAAQAAVVRERDRICHALADRPGVILETISTGRPAGKTEAVVTYTYEGIRYRLAITRDDI